MNKQPKTAVVLQPSYLPWLGYLEQVYRADIFVLYDEVQFDKHGWRNRNRIKTAQGEQWLTVPVLTKGKNKPTNAQVQIDQLKNWAQTHLKAIQQNYQKSPFFEDYFPALSADLQMPWESLADLNEKLLTTLMEFLGFQRPIIRSSTLPRRRSAYQNNIDRLVEICQELECLKFLEGQAGKDYIDDQLFTSQGVEIEYQAYEHPTYAQRYVKQAGFVPYLSVIDLLFNEGPRSLSILTNDPQASR